MVRHAVCGDREEKNLGTSLQCVIATLGSPRHGDISGTGPLDQWYLLSIYSAQGTVLRPWRHSCKPERCSWHYILFSGSFESGHHENRMVTLLRLWPTYIQYMEEAKQEVGKSDVAAAGMKDLGKRVGIIRCKTGSHYKSWKWTRKRKIRFQLVFWSQGGLDILEET